MGGFSPWHYYSGSNAILWGTANNGSGLSSCVFTRTEKQLQKQFKAHPVFLPIPREKNTEHQEPAPGRDWKHFCLLHFLLLASPGETALDGMLYLHGEETKLDALWWWRLAPTAPLSWHLAQGSWPVSTPLMPQWKNSAPSPQRTGKTVSGQLPSNARALKKIVAQSCLTLRPHGLWPTRLLCTWNSPGKHTGAGCHFCPDSGIKTRSLVLQTDSLSRDKGTLKKLGKEGFFHTRWKAQHRMWDLFFFFNYLFDCTGSQLWPAGSSSPRRDQTWAPPRWELGLSGTGRPGKSLCGLISLGKKVFQAQGAFSRGRVRASKDGIWGCPPTNEGKILKHLLLNTGLHIFGLLLQKDERYLGLLINMFCATLETSLWTICF